MRKSASSFPMWVASSPGVTHKGPMRQAPGVPHPLPRAWDELTLPHLQLLPPTCASGGGGASVPGELDGSTSALHASFHTRCRDKPHPSSSTGAGGASIIITITHR